MKTKLIKVEELPQKIREGSSFEIVTKDLGYFTHSFFKYPCKFIPQIPKWAIEKYTNENDLVLDCFAGSGTSLVEAVLLKRNGLAIDFDRLSHLLCVTKANLLTEDEIQFIKSNTNKLTNKSSSVKFYPDIHNTKHWFSEDVINHLSNIRSNIESIENISIKNFFLVCFASIIKKVSFADDNSPKPYVSRKHPKSPYKVEDLFLKTVRNNLLRIDQYKNHKIGSIKIIGQDARHINLKEYYRKIDLVITSPPYINAFDYVRSLRLENAWLGYFGDSNIIEIKKKQIGTEYISSLKYNSKINPTGINKLDFIIKKLFEIDKKRAYVVYMYFKDMQENIISISNLLKQDCHYVIVVGNSVIRGIEIPTHEILMEIAEKNGYSIDNYFSYIIKNRYLRIPRSGKGGLIKYDWVIDLKLK